MEVTTTILRNPFKFLTSYGRNEHSPFEGRKAEIDALYDLLRRRNIVLVYGESGVGKTSLIQCGLANKFQSADWFDVLVLRKDNINTSLQETLLSHIETPLPPQADKDALQLIDTLYIENFKPVYLIFDQLEELYVFGKQEEIGEFYSTIANILRTRSNTCKIILVLRTEFHGELNDFHNKIAPVFDCQLRIERMKPPVGKTVIESLFHEHEAALKVEPGIEQVSSQIANALGQKGDINLLQLQVFLFYLWNKASLLPMDGDRVVITSDLVERISKIEDPLKEYVHETVAEIGNEKEAGVWSLLRHFVSEKDTKKIVHKSDIINLPPADVDEWIRELIEKEILKQTDSEHYELMHDSLAPIITLAQTRNVRTKLTDPPIKGNPYKGLASFDPEDSDRFFGREKVLAELLRKVEDNDLVALVGPSGCGKSSITKAGIIPKLISLGYADMIEKPGKNPGRIIESFHQLLKTVDPNKNIVLFIDQFEELNTQTESHEECDKFIAFLKWLLAENGNSNRKIKVLLSVREDYEQEFDQFFADKWAESKFNIPPFGDEELQLVITEPAYYAGLEFSPDYLVDTIVRDARRSKGAALPLLSFALSETYEKYKEEIKKTGTITEEMYNGIGGVIGGLEKRADGIVERCSDERIVRNVMLRMVAFGEGERAGKRAFRSEFIYPNDAESQRVSEVLDEFISRKLVVAGTNNGNAYVEPAHDALVRNWQRARKWTNDHQDILYLQRNLAQGLATYKKFETLWNSDPRLAEAKAVSESTDDWLNKEEAGFVTASIREKRRLKRSQRFYAGIYLGLIGFAIAAAFYSQWNKSEAKKKAKEEANAANVMALKQKSDSINKFNASLIISYNSLSASNNQLVAQKQLSDSLYRETLALSEQKRLSEEKRAEISAKALADNKKLLDELSLSYDLSTQKADSMTRLLTQVNLQSEYFYRSLNFSDARQKQDLIDTLIALKFTKKDPAKFESFKNSLNLLAYASDDDEINPNNRFFKIKQSYQQYPHIGIDTLGASTINKYLYYTQKLNIGRQDALVLRTPVIASLARNKNFAITTDSRLLTGKYANGKIAIDNQISLYRLSGNYENDSVNVSGFLPVNAKLLTMTCTADNRVIGVTASQAYIWNGNTRKSSTIDLPQSKLAYTAAVSPDGRNIVIDYKDHSVAMVDVANPKKLIKLFDTDKKSTAWITGIQFSPDGNILLVNNSYGGYWLYWLKTKYSNRFQCAIQSATNFSFTPDSRYLTCTLRDSIFLVDLNGIRVGRGIRWTQGSVVNKVILSPDWKDLIVQSTRGAANITSELYETWKPKEKDSVFSMIARSNADRTTIKKSFLGDGNFGFADDGLVLSYTNNPTSGLAVYLNKNFGEFDNFSKADQAIKLPDSDEDQYELAMSYYEQARPALGLAAYLGSLYRSRLLFESLLDHDSKRQEQYLESYRELYHTIFNVDSNYRSMCSGLRLYVQKGEQILKQKPRDSDTKTNLAFEYGNLSWYAIFIPGQDYNQVIQDASRSVALDPYYCDWANTNLALGYLLSKRFKEAKAVYTKFRKQSYNSRSRTFKDAFLEDLATLRRKKVISEAQPDVYAQADLIEKWLRDEITSLD